MKGEFTLKAFRVMVLTVIAAVCFMTAAAVFAAGDSAAKNIRLWIGNSNMEVNGTAMKVDASDPSVSPVVLNGRTLVPIRAVIEGLGGTVGFEAPQNSIRLALNGNNLTLQLGSNQGVLNGKPVVLETPPVVKNGRTLLPLRFVGESLGASVQWDPGTQGITLSSSPAAAPGNASKAPKPVVTITMESGELVKVELEPAAAPNTVNNFIALVQKGYYDGLTFHRIISGFMIQGGDPTVTGAGGPGYGIKGEFTANGVANPLSHTAGVISMARASAPDSAGSQFFIVHKDSTFLDGQYAAFGKVISGMDVVDRIAEVKTDERDKPLTPVVIRKMTVELNGYAYNPPVVIQN